MRTRTWATPRVCATVALSGAVELALLAVVGSHVSRLAELLPVVDDAVATAEAMESALVVLACAVALSAWTRWCLLLAQTLVALTSDRAGSLHGVTGADGVPRRRRSTAVVLVLGLGAVAAPSPAAVATDDERLPRLDGLRLPDLPAAPLRADNWPTEEAGCSPQTVVVASGDSLWTLAAAHLATPAAAGSRPTAGQIDRSWPRWHAHNRTVIGPDPDLLLPGQRLQPPLPDTCPRRTVQ